ncbi:MAG: serine/threonine-protein phosphatase [Deltaproteobacteria bacterium]|nr:serine/threonine-protein phosphatase [Deltaproteobacteria bacterium]
MEVFSLTHQGFKRADNQDRFFVRSYDSGIWLLAVADGMGGEAAGDQAAQCAIESLEDFNPVTEDPIAQLLTLYKQASNNIYERVRENNHLSGMGTTLTAAFLKEEKVYWAHVGDSRIYLLTGGVLQRITWDHTLPDTLLKEGDITPEEARNHPAQNMLLQCVGCGRFKASTGIFRINKGDLLLLSSDGLHHEVPEKVIQDLLDSGGSLENRLQALVKAALDAGGRDNITVVGALV